MSKYPFNEIEPKWQKYWEENKTFKAEEDPSFPKEKRAYVLDMFPYPSGAGLHVGHPEGYTATDIYSRFLRMTGYNVLHPMGFDSFGYDPVFFSDEAGQIVADLPLGEKGKYSHRGKAARVMYELIKKEIEK